MKTNQNLNESSNSREAFFVLIQNQLSTIFDTSEAKNITSLIFEDLLQITASEYILNKQLALTQHEIQAVLQALEKLMLNVPVQHILGKADFYGLKFKVNQDVLIPRQETEELVHFVIQFVQKNYPNAPIHILDLGTGSGCIAITLAHKIPQSKVIAVDISSGALVIAKENAASLNISNIDFKEKDMLSLSEKDFEHPFHIIVSNPPYITESEKQEMKEQVLAHEPHSALFVPEENPLIFHHKIADLASNLLHKNGLVMAEINEFLPQESLESFQKEALSEVELVLDMQQKHRFVKGIKK